MKGLFFKPFTFLIHIALAIIVAGAMITHFAGIQGTLTLVDGGAPTVRFERSSGPGDGTFPFSVSLVSAEPVFYPGTTTPMDFRSRILVDGKELTIAMNSVGEYEGWRFYQSGMSAYSSTFSISHDPWGIGVTYTGYALLGIGMIGFFFQRRTPWRALLRAGRVAACALLLVLPALSASAAEPDRLPCMQRPLAANMCKAYVYWNDRVCPLQTMAYDVTAKLYGSLSHDGLTPEQVLSGWLFYYDAWLRDFENNQKTPTTAKQRKRAEERQALVQWLGTGEAFRIFPYKTAAGHMEWLSLTGRRPSQMSLEQWKFMLSSVRDINSDLQRGRNISANERITDLIAGQRLYAGEENLPSSARMNAERFLHSYVRLVPLAIIILLAGAFFLWKGLSAARNDSRRQLKADRLWLQRCIAALVAILLLTVLLLRGWAAGHWPLSNGCETMLFMAFVASAGAPFVRNRTICGALLLVAAFAVFVAAMAGKTPQIGALMPVLHSPLLSIHVMLVMCSYVLFMLMAILAAVALSRHKHGQHSHDMEANITRVNRIVLVPALFLLTAGIFIGAVWANQSWGRYWGWDPKETCALVTMLIYAVPVHSASLKWFRRNRNLNVYLLLAILSVLFTYFGANYLLPGLHSYA